MGFYKLSESKRQALRYVFYRKRFQLPKNYCKTNHAPDVSKEERKEIDEYWKQYGIRIRDYSWFRMYYNVTGIHDPRFLPDDIAGLVVYPYYNDDKYKFAWRDKNYFDRLLPNVPMPETVCKSIRGRLLWDGEYHSFDEPESNLAAFYLEYCMKNQCSLIVKPSRDTGLGKNVKKYTIRSKEDALRLIDDWKNVKDYIVQRCVQQHDVLASFNEDSTNMLRIYSWRHDNKVEIMFATVRAGIPGKVTDVSFVNGVETVHLVGISPEGDIHDRMMDQDGHVIQELPSGRKLPAWDKIVSIIKENHLYVDNFDVIGWDFTVDTDEKPICFEWNIVWPGTVFYQYTNGPLFGRCTDEMLSFLKEKENQKKYLPFFMRIR